MQFRVALLMAGQVSTNSCKPVSLCPKRRRTAKPTTAEVNNATPAARPVTKLEDVIPEKTKHSFLTVVEGVEPIQQENPDDQREKMT